MDDLAEHPWPLKDIQEPHENDVLCGRGGGTNSHPGNKYFREIVESRRLDYINAKKNRDKYVLTMDIVFQIRGLNPPGRFISQDKHTNLWNDIGDKNARLKTSQAFRENAPVLKKQLEDFEHDSEESPTLLSKELHPKTGYVNKKDSPPRKISCVKKMDGLARAEVTNPKILLDPPIHDPPNQQLNNGINSGKINNGAFELDACMSELEEHPGTTYLVHTKNLNELKRDPSEERDKKEFRKISLHKARRKELPCSFYKAFARRTSMKSIRLHDYEIDSSINRNIDPYNDPSMDCITGPFGCSRRDIYGGTFPTESAVSESDLFNSAIDFELITQNTYSNKDASASNDEDKNAYTVSPLKLNRKLSNKPNCLHHRSLSDSSMKDMMNNGDSYSTSMQSFPLDISGRSFDISLRRSFSFHRSMSNTNMPTDSSMSTFDMHSNPSILSIATSVFSSSSMRRFSMDL